MFSPWCYILFIIVFDLVNANSQISTGKGHEIVKKNIREDGSGNDTKTDDTGNTEDDHGDGNDESETEYEDSNGNASDGSDENDNENVQYINGDSEDRDKMTRALQAGDTFTPVELLPVTKKLLNKIEIVGEGRGIVSSSKSPEDLADRLFAALFLNMKRIVFLDEKDLSSLDALQALALEGEVVDFRNGGDSVTEAPHRMVNVRGQLVGLDDEALKCHYRLMSKKVDVSKDTNLRSRNKHRQFNKVLKLEKRLRPNRHLVVNNARKSIKRKNIHMRSDVDKDGEKNVEKDREKERRNKISRHNINKAHRKVRKQKKKRPKKSRVIRNKKSTLKRKHRKKKTANLSGRKSKYLRNKNVNTEQITTTERPKCRWRYICHNPGDMDSCRLHTSCVDDTNPLAQVDGIYVDHNEDEHSEQVKQFRKMMGITLVDEDVEKIIQYHIIQTRPQNMKGLEDIETLEEYFNNIILQQHSRTTTPVPSSDITGHAHMLMEKNAPVQQLKTSGELMPTEGQADAKEDQTTKAQPVGRQTFNLPMTSTTHK